MEKFNHPFDENRCARRLLWEYKNYEQLIVGVDFDNTIRPVKQDSSCEAVVELLKRCSADPKIVLCLWTISGGSDGHLSLQEKVEYCKSLGIKLDYINKSPFLEDDSGRKQFFNVLLDDRAGLESAYRNLKYVLDNSETVVSDERIMTKEDLKEYNNAIERFYKACGRVCDELSRYDHNFDRGLYLFKYTYEEYSENVECEGTYFTMSFPSELLSYSDEQLKEHVDMLIERKRVKKEIESKELEQKEYLDYLRLKEKFEPKC